MDARRLYRLHPRTVTGTPAANSSRRYSGDGQVYPVRRFFQRPRQVRASLRFRF